MASRRSGHLPVPASILVLALPVLLPSVARAQSVGGETSDPACVLDILLEGGELIDVRPWAEPGNPPDTQITMQAPGLVSARVTARCALGDPPASDDCYTFHRFIRFGGWIQNLDTSSRSEAVTVFEVDPTKTPDDARSQVLDGVVQLMIHGTKIPDTDPLLCQAGDFDAIDKEVAFRVSVGVFKERNFRVEAYDSVLTVVTYRIRMERIEGVLIGRRMPWVGARVEPEAEGVRFSPSSASSTAGTWQTEEVGVASFAMIPSPQLFEGAASARTPGVNPLPPIFEGIPGVAQADLAVAVDGKDERRQSVSITYATLEAMRGIVVRKDALGGSVPAQAGDKLAPGTTLILMKGADGISPMVGIRYFNRTTGQVDFFGKEGEVVVRVGDATFETAAWEPMRLEVKNLVLDVQQNSREWLQCVVENVMVDAATAGLSRFGRVVKKVGETAVEYSYGRVKKWWYGTTPRLLGTPYDAPPFGTAGIASLQIAFRGDGWQILRNRGGPVAVSGGHDALVPPGATLVFEEASPGQTASVEAMAPPAGAGPVDIALEPVDGGAVESRTPVLRVSWPASATDPVDPTSFLLRVNGRWVADQAVIGAGQAEFAVPPDRPLAPGQNTLEAAISTYDGLRSRARATFTATGDPAVPTGVSSLSGRATVTVRWDRAPDPEARYRVTRAAAADVPGDTVADGLPEPVFVDASPLPGTNCYAVVLVDAQGTASEPAPARCATPAPIVPLPLPAAVPAPDVQAGDGMATLAFGPAGDATLLWRLERAESADGPFAPVAVPGGLVAGPRFVDRDAVNGTAYWYRLTPLGRDLVAGEPAIVGPVLAEDRPPPAPAHLTVERTDDRVRLAWDPVDVPDLDGYHVYRALPEGALERLTDQPLPDPAMDLPLDDATLVAYVVTAVDDAAEESSPSDAAFVSGLPIPPPVPPDTGDAGDDLPGMPDAWDVGIPADAVGPDAVVPDGSASRSGDGCAAGTGGGVAGPAMLLVVLLVLVLRRRAAPGAPDMAGQGD